MAKYQFFIKPLEPYFLGTERTFNYGSKTKNHQRAGSYHIESDTVPSQTTILGLLRNLLLGNLKKDDFDYSTDELARLNDRIGSKSFDLADPKWDYGCIQSLSPVMLSDRKKEKLLVPLPLNHVAFEKDKSGKKQRNTAYRPMFLAEKPVETCNGKKYLPIDYNAKDGLLYDAYMCIDDQKKGTVVTDLFRFIDQVGINRTSIDDGGFFRKKYCALDDDYCFTFYADIKSEEIEKDEQLSFMFDASESVLVYLGKGRSTFSLSAKQVDETKYEQEKAQIAEIIQSKLNCQDQHYSWVYALSDIRTDNQIYDACAFASTSTREFRARTTDLSAKRFKVSDRLYTMIKAGSFFVIENKEKIETTINNDKTSKAIENIGWNQLIFGGKQ